MNLEQKFKIYHAENPHIWEAVKEYTYKYTFAGHTVLSINRVFEAIRWDTMVKGNDEYKMNNNYRAFYARMWNNLFAEFGAEFRIRTQKFKGE